MNKYTTINKQISLKDYRHWLELNNLTRELLDNVNHEVLDEVKNEHSWALSHLFDFSNSILKDLEKLEQPLEVKKENEDE